MKRIILAAFAACSIMTAQAQWLSPEAANGAVLGGLAGGLIAAGTGGRHVGEGVGIGLASGLFLGTLAHAANSDSYRSRYPVYSYGYYGYGYRRPYHYYAPFYASYSYTPPVYYAPPVVAAAPTITTPTFSVPSMTAPNYATSAGDGLSLQPADPSSAPPPTIYYGHPNSQVQSANVLFGR